MHLVKVNVVLTSIYFLHAFSELTPKTLAFLGSVSLVSGGELHSSTTCFPLKT